MLKSTKILFVLCLMSILSLGAILYLQYTKIEAQKKEIDLHTKDIQNIENQIDLLNGYENQDINEKVQHLESQIEDLENKIKDLESKTDNIQFYKE